MIDARGLTKRYGEKLAVDDLTFKVNPGIVTGFLGPNGSGKSTTMRLILGLDAPTGGSVTVNGKAYRDHAAPLHEVGVLLEARAVHTGRSAYNHLLALAQTHGIPRQRVQELIEHRFTGGPPNAETAAQLLASKPRLQTALQQTTAMACGPVPDEGGPWQEASWAQMLTLYLVYQQEVDAQIGRVLDALHARPELEANTIVIFTADHGEYAGSHGLRAKGGGAYEEAIHVPLYIYDPRGQLSRGASARSQLTSTVDLAPLLLTIAHGSSSWRSDPGYSQIASRADIAAIAANPKTSGRPWIAHVTDETTVEELSYTYSFANQAPHHVAAVRTPAAKYAVYSAWRNGTIEVDPLDQDFELYDYSTVQGRRELANVAGPASSLDARMSHLLESQVIPNEVRAPLPSRC
jgi:arylsulfatase A-like enzyme